MKKSLLFTLAAVLLSLGSFALPISGPSFGCIGGTAHLSDTTSPGGAWSSSNPSVATIDATGTVTGISAGTATITYLVGASFSTLSYTVEPSPAAITGPSLVCAGSTASFADATSGGTWSTSSSVASINYLSGVATATSAGTTTISYTSATGCSATATLSVASPYVDSILGPAGVCVGNSISLTESTPGGTWTCTPSSVATVSSAGVVTGTTPGSALVVYTTSSVCGSSTSIHRYIEVGPTTLGSITGPSTVVAGSYVYQSCSPYGGIWSTTNSAATINTAGQLTGVSAGTDTVVYTIELCGGTFNAYNIVTITAPALSISGPSSGCIGMNSYFSDSAATGGMWTSSDASIATVDSITGVVTGVAAGSVTITYSLAGAIATQSYTVNAAPLSIYGPSTVCVGGTISLSDATGGGIWSSSAPGIATVSLGGIVSGIAAGTTFIIYTIPTGCSTMLAVTVSSSGGAIDSISGAGTVCAGYTTTFADATPGGTWVSSIPSIATIDPATGIITGVALGTAYITYTVTGGCGSSYSVHPIMVVNTTSAGTLSGPTTVTAGGTITVSPTIYGGTFSSSNTSIATVNATSGLVTGVSAGTATISYTITGCGGTYTTTYTITVTAANSISGYINFASSYTGSVKVWLITLSGTTLAAVDSTVVTCTGDSVYYQFLGEPTNNYRMKAAVTDTTGAATGYVPTYHTSSYYWNTANVLAHSASASDVYQDINMNYGTVTTGPGFIGGDVTTGANKNTSGGLPVKGLMMYCVNTATSQLVQSTRTNATGAYSFSNLPVGQTYFIFPDSLNYITTAYTGIALTAAIPSMTTASFIQHTLSGTITPVAAAVANVNVTGATVTIFPNPAAGKLNIQWNVPDAQEGILTIADVAGRELISTSIAMTPGTGNAQIDLSSLSNGIYVISVKSAAINYVNKINVQH